MEFKVYTDGGCSGNKRDAGCPGGFGYIILDAADSILLSNGGREENTTNNRMEMMAVIEGTRALTELLNQEWVDSNEHDCVVFTDSRYVCDNYEDYLLGWKKNGWKKANGKPVLNVDLWKRIDLAAPEFKSFRFRWVKGHASNRFNIMVDEIAQNHIRGGELSHAVSP